MRPSGFNQMIEHARVQNVPPFEGLTALLFLCFFFLKKKSLCFFFLYLSKIQKVPPFEGLTALLFLCVA